MLFAVWNAPIIGIESIFFKFKVKLEKKYMYYELKSLSIFFLFDCLYTLNNEQAG